MANPRAGQCDPALLRAILDTLFGLSGLDYQLHIMDTGEELGEVIRSALAGGCDLVVAAGGDGTVAAVANHLVGRDVPLAILPVGTGNALAREVGVPSSLPDAAALLVGPHRLVPLDGFRVGTHHYFVNAGIGLNAAIIRDTRSEEKRIFGTLAYGFALIHWVMGHGATRFRIRVDGRNRRYRAWDVFVANIGVIGATSVHWGPFISARDGHLDLLVVRVPTPSDYLRMIWRLMTGGTLDRVLISHYRVRREAEIVADRPLAIQADGELIQASRLTVEVVPRAIRIVVPPAGGRAARIAPGERRAAEQIRESLGSRVGALARLDTRAFLLAGRLPHTPVVDAALRAARVAPAAIAGLLVARRLAAGARSGALPGSAIRDVFARVLVPAGLTWGLVALPLRLLLGRQRVTEAAVLAPVSAIKPSAWSSPDARTAATFAAARLLCRVLPAWGRPVRIVALLLGASRVYLGAHYASDVLVGGLCGWLLAPAVASLVERARGVRTGRGAGR